MGTHFDNTSRENGAGLAREPLHETPGNESAPAVAPDPQPPPQTINLDTMCLVPIGVHLLLLTWTMFLLPWHGGGEGFALDCLVASHLPMLSLGMSFGPRPLWLRSIAAVTATWMLTLGLRGASHLWHAVLWHHFGRQWLCFYLIVGLCLAADLESVCAPSSLPTRQRAAQFTLGVIYTVLAALTLFLAVCLVATPYNAKYLLVLVGAFWSLWTGLLLAREPLLRLPRGWHLLSLMVAACAAIAIKRMESQQSLLSCVSLVLTSASGVGVLLFLRHFGYRKKNPTLEEHLHKARAIVWPESEPSEESWRALEDPVADDSVTEEIAEEPAERGPDVPA